MSGDDTNEKNGDSPKYSVPALDKGLDILELLSDTALSMSQVDIARSLGRNVGEIFRILTALEARGYIRRTQGGQYRLTLKLFELSRTHSPYEELLRIAQPIMHELSEELNETCHLTTLRGGEIVVLAQNEAPKPLRLSIEVGSRHSPLATTSGRILLAAMSDDDRTAFLRDYTAFDKLPKAGQRQFLEKVQGVKEQGYAIAEGERFIGGVDVGVLVGTPDSLTKAALIVATLKGPGAEPPSLDRMSKAVIAAGEKITQLLGVD